MKDKYIEISKTNLRGHSYRILFYMMSHENDGVIQSIKQSDISSALSIPQCNVARSIRELKDSNIIEVIKIGRKNIYKMKGVNSED